MKKIITLICLIILCFLTTSIECSEYDGCDLGLISLDDIRPTAKVKKSPQDLINDNITNLPRFGVAVEQAEEGQHHLETFNYHLAFANQTDTGNHFLSIVSQKSGGGHHIGVENINTLNQTLMRDHTQYHIKYDTDKIRFQRENHTVKYDLKADLRFHRFTHGDIIYVYGTSTSGKTTFTRELAKLLPEYTLVSTRDLKTKYMAKIINEVCCEEYAYVSQFINTDTILIFLARGILPIPESPLPKNNYEEIVSNLNQIKAKDDSIKMRYHPIEELYYVYDYIFMLSEKNKNVIVDNLDVSGFLTYISIYNIHCPLHLLLLYCPASILLERVIKRNNIAMKKDLMDRRSLMRPLETFINIYTPTKNESFIDEIQRDSLIKIYSTAYFMSQEEGAGDKHSMSHIPWQKVVNILNSNFGISHSIKLESKYPYCMLLNTSKETAEVLALRIHFHIVE